VAFESSEHRPAAVATAAQGYPAEIRSGLERHSNGIRFTFGKYSGKPAATRQFAPVGERRPAPARALPGGRPSSPDPPFTPTPQER
jgi:hypothetical protein